MAAPVVRRSGAGRRQADGHPSHVVMSGVLDNGQQSGHRNIDANDPTADVLSSRRENNQLSSFGCTVRPISTFL
jgi:hypothetical protein